jgi:cytosine/adenosine deaminase-related metal-dependent hydrolase
LSDPGGTLAGPTNDGGSCGYTDIGIRANVGISLFDRPFFRAVPFVEEEFSKDLLARLVYSADELLAFVTNLARTKHPKENRVGYIATPSAPQRCTEEFLLKVRRMADDHDLPLMIHVQETRMQVVTGQLWYGSTMIEYLHRIGFMKPKTAFIHGIWLNPGEIEILVRTGVSIQHNPTSNLKVGSGLAPIRALLDAGVNVSMGTDGCGSIGAPTCRTLSILRHCCRSCAATTRPGWVRPKRSTPPRWAGRRRWVARRSSVRSRRAESPIWSATGSTDLVHAAQ